MGHWTHGLWKYLGMGPRGHSPTTKGAMDTGAWDRWGMMHLGHRTHKVLHYLGMDSGDTTPTGVGIWTLEHLTDGVRYTSVAGPIRCGTILGMGPIEHNSNRSGAMETGTLDRWSIVHLGHRTHKVWNYLGMSPAYITPTGVVLWTLPRGTDGVRCTCNSGSMGCGTIWAWALGV